MKNKTIDETPESMLTEDLLAGMPIVKLPPDPDLNAIAAQDSQFFIDNPKRRYYDRIAHPLEFPEKPNTMVRVYQITPQLRLKLPFAPGDIAQIPYDLETDPRRTKFVNDFLQALIHEAHIARAESTKGPSSFYRLG